MSTVARIVRAGLLGFPVELHQLRLPAVQVEGLRAGDGFRLAEVTPPHNQTDPSSAIAQGTWLCADKQCIAKAN